MLFFIGVRVSRKDGELASKTFQRKPWKKESARHRNTKPIGQQSEK
jgi:hypothetical protein